MGKIASVERKVVVIGAGAVGTTYIYALMRDGLASEIVLVDVDRKKAEGEVMDLSHGLFFVPPLKIRTGDYSDCQDAEMIVITAGAKQQPGQSRTELVQKNADIVKSICDRINETETSAVVVMVANPVDALTKVALERLGWPRERVFGSGTVLDSARFRYMLSQHCSIDPRNIHAYILGEHGDSEVAAWSMSHIAGTSMKDYCHDICKKCDTSEEHKRITEKVRDSAYHIIDYKGSTFYAIGLSLLRISEAILRDENSVLTVSVNLQGEYGINDICLSVPCVIGETGIKQIIHSPLPANEQTALEKSAQAIAGTLEKIQF